MISTRLDVNASKGVSEEVSKSLYVPLSQIDTYLFDGGITTLLGKTTDSDYVGVTDILSGDLKNSVLACVF